MLDTVVSTTVETSELGNSFFSNFLKEFTYYIWFSQRRIEDSVCSTTCVIMIMILSSIGINI